MGAGGFVASSGLESFFAHGLLHNVRPVESLAQYENQYQYQYQNTTSAAVPGRTGPASQAQLSASTLSFARSTLHSYARSAFPFLSRVHELVHTYISTHLRKRTPGPDADAHADGHHEYEYAADAHAAALRETLSSISWLDHAYHSLLLNHVARRASTTQGIALLTLYTKAFARPISLDSQHFSGSRLGTPAPAPDQDQDARRIHVAATLVDSLKRDIRRSAAARTASEPAWSRQHGHLPICWAVFSACIGLSRTRAIRLHLFLQARSLFSSSIRLNTLGPYLAHQLMRFQLRDVIDDIVTELESQGVLHPHPHPYPSSTDMETETGAQAATEAVRDHDQDQGWAWDWPEDGAHEYLDPGQVGASHGHGFWTASSAPATTFPLGEIVQARHDQLHSRLFNS